MEFDRVSKARLPQTELARTELLSLVLDLADVVLSSRSIDLKIKCLILSAITVGTIVQVFQMI
jgi:hypothetical protein